MRDSAGVTVVAAASMALTARDPHPLEPYPFRVPMPEFGDITDVALATDGQLVALDPLEVRVVVVDSAGEEVSTFGREGAGPGELRGTGLSSVLVLDDSVFVPDPLNRRMTIYSRGGDLLRMFPLDLQAGVTLDWRVHPTEGLLVRRRGAASQTIELLLDDQLREVLSLESLELPEASGPLAALPLWCVFPDGRIAVGRADQYRVQVHDETGVVAILRTDQMPQLLTEDGVGHVQDLMMQSLDRIPADQVSPELVERMLSGVIFPEHVPQIAALACPTDEELWVQRATRVEAMGPGVLRVGSAAAFGGPIWDVWNLADGTVGPVRVPAGARVTHVSAELVVGFSTDDFGVKSLARWRHR